MTVREIYLKAKWHGKTLNQSIGSWSRMTGIKHSSISRRHHSRLAGKNKCTDEEVIFGSNNTEDEFQKFCFSNPLHHA